MNANDNQYGNKNDYQLYAAMVDFGDGAPALIIDDTGTGNPAEINTATNGANKALCAFGLIFTIVGQAALALAIAAGGDPFIGTTGAIGIAGCGLGFAFAGTGKGAPDA